MKIVLYCIVARFSLTFKGPNPENFSLRGRGPVWQGASKRPKKWSGEAPAGEREEEAQSQYKNRLGQVKRRRKKKKLDQGEEG